VSKFKRDVIHPDPEDTPVTPSDVICAAPVGRAWPYLRLDSLEGGAAIEAFLPDKHINRRGASGIEKGSYLIGDVPLGDGLTERASDAGRDCATGGVGGRLTFCFHIRAALRLAVSVLALAVSDALWFAGHGGSPFLARSPAYADRRIGL